MRKSLLKEKKGTFDVDNASNVISGIMFIAILLAVLLLVIVIVFGLTVFTTSDINATFATIQTNIVGMVTNFFALMPTVGTILAVVVLIAVIVLLVLYVARMKNAGSGATTQGFQG